MITARAELLKQGDFFCEFVDLYKTLPIPLTFHQFRAVISNNKIQKGGRLMKRFSIYYGHKIIFTKKRSAMKMGLSYFAL